MDKAHEKQRSLSCYWRCANRQRASPSNRLIHRRYLAGWITLEKLTNELVSYIVITRERQMRGDNRIAILSRVNKRRWPCRPNFLRGASKGCSSSSLVAELSESTLGFRDGV